MATGKEVNEIIDSRTINFDFIDLFLGNKIGVGVAREVYTCKSDPSIVIKIEYPQESFQNILEWEFWEKFSHDKEIKKWLAPCIAISQAGTILVQKRIEPVRESELPEKVPGFLTDLKKENFGKIGRQLVCVDYGHTITSVDKRIKKVSWNI